MSQNPHYRRIGKKRRNAGKRKVRRGAYQIQEIHLDASSFNRARAVAWLKKHGHRPDRISRARGKYHAEQHDDFDYDPDTLHRVHIAKHVEATMGVPIPGTEASRAPGYNKRFRQRQRELFSEKKQRRTRKRKPSRQKEPEYDPTAGWGEGEEALF